MKPKPQVIIGFQCSHPFSPFFTLSFLSLLFFFSLVMMQRSLEDWVVTYYLAIGPCDIIAFRLFLPPCVRILTSWLGFLELFWFCRLPNFFIFFLPLPLLSNQVSVWKGKVEASKKNPLSEFLGSGSAVGVQLHNAYHHSWISTQIEKSMHVYGR